LTVKALFHSPNVRELLVLALFSRTMAAPAVTYSFFKSPLPEQLLRLQLYSADGADVPGRYREALGDRLVVSPELD
jgi:hypothetical protein